MPSFLVPVLRQAAAVLLLCLAGGLFAHDPASAVEPDEILADAALEARARHISADLRCLVCQNQSIDDSHAPLARDLRLLVRERLKSGDSDAAVRAFIVERYGDFVLLRPPFSAHTILLWLAPVLLLVAGLVAVGRKVRQHPLSQIPPLSTREQARLDRILGGDR